MFWVIHESSSRERKTVNDGTSLDCRSVRHQSIDVCQLILKFGRGCQLAKTDVEHVYKI